MGSYNLLFKKSSEKELRKNRPPLLKRIVDKVGALSRNPRPSGSVVLKGLSEFYRIRQGDYRIVYEADDLKQEVTIIKIGHRREVYD